MATVLSFLSGRQITNDNGVPQAGAKLYHYQAGTTTNLTVYSNQAGTTAHAQPVVCDAGGFVPLIYVSDASDWKVLVTTSADVTLRTYDNLPAAEVETSTSSFAAPLLTWNQKTSANSPVALVAADAGQAYEADTTGGSIEFDLPSAASVGNGKGFFFKKTAAANTLTIDPSGSETIDDTSTSQAITVKDTILGIMSNGAEWYKTFLNTRLNVQVFTGSGTYTPTVGMQQCLVISTGGGGGGGGADGGGGDCGGGSGGGAGATCIELFAASDIGASQTVTIGAAGTAGANTGGNGGNGGNTTFGALHTAGGGTGGNGIVANDNDTFTLGVAGGTATGGLINITGGDGSLGEGNGLPTGSFGMGGTGGASFWGGGGRGSAAEASSLAGSNGGAFGSGGGGASVGDTATGAAGGTGAAGICVVIEIY